MGFYPLTAPSFGFSGHLLMGDDFRAMASNQLRNLEENRIALIEVVARKTICVDRPSGS